MGMVWVPLMWPGGVPLLGILEKSLLFRSVADVDPENAWRLDVCFCCAFFLWKGAWWGKLWGFWGVKWWNSYRYIERVGWILHGVLFFWLPANFNQTRLSISTSFLCFAKCWLLCQFVYSTPCLRERSIYISLMYILSLLPCCLLFGWNLHCLRRGDFRKTYFRIYFSCT